jgi:hypothetical protein
MKERRPARPSMLAAHAVVTFAWTQRAATGIRSGAGVRYGPLRKGLREVPRATASEVQSQEVDFKLPDF